MSKPNDYVIIAPVSENGNIQRPFLKKKKSWLWVLFERFAWAVVVLIYLAICGAAIWIYQGAY